MDAGTPSADRRGRYPSARIIWILAATFLFLGAVLFAWVPGVLLRSWLPDADLEERTKMLGTAGQLVLFGLGGVIAITGVALSLSRHGQELMASEREAEAHKQSRDRDLRARFVTAVELLSDSESPVKRVSALYALSALADDWDTLGREDEVQVCVDVICGYLRAPLADGVGRTPKDEISVRRAGYDLIAVHLRQNIPYVAKRRNSHSWSERLLDLSRVHIDFDVDLSSAVFNELLNLRDATVTGEGRLNLVNSSIEGLGHIDLSNSHIATGARIDLRNSVCDAHPAVSFDESTINGEISMDRIELHEDAWLAFARADIGKGAHIDLTDATIVDRGCVTFEGAQITGDARVDLLNVCVVPDGDDSPISAVLSFEGVTGLEGAVIDSTARSGTMQLPDGSYIVPTLVST